MIHSKSDLCRGELVEKPRRVKTVIYDKDDEPICKCPNCGAMNSEDDCDMGGCEPGCLFCNQCNREFEP
jgi:hypothetical protein